MLIMLYYFVFLVAHIIIVEEFGYEIVIVGAVSALAIAAFVVGSRHWTRSAIERERQRERGRERERERDRERERERNRERNRETV